MSALIKRTEPLSGVKGIGPKMAEKFSQMGLLTVGDLLGHTPLRYEDWSSPRPISEFRISDNVVFRGTIEKAFHRRIFRKGLSMTEVRLRDESGIISLIWFNQPYVKYGFKEGDDIVGSGKVSIGKKNNLFISNPSYEIVREETVFGVMPVYRRVRGLSSKGIWTAVKKIIYSAEPAKEFIPEKILKLENIPDINECIKGIHVPEDIKEAIRAKKRFAFENLFLIQLSSLIQKKQLLDMKGPMIADDVDFAKELLSFIPFPLTFAQKRSLWEIMNDMKAGHPMNRLLQGDVGSGKTVVAALSAIMGAKQGFQSAIMAPTEILARQHYLTFRSLFGHLDIPFTLVTGKETLVFYGKDLESSVKRKDILEDIRRGKIKIVIGTHSLISESKTNAVEFGKLGLVVVDEQHRFGVDQRGKIAQKSGLKDHLVPHFLSMSATPIPRTVAISMFGDLDLSLIDELPKERKPITTKVIPPEARNRAYEFIREEVKKGRQVFIVCSRIEKTEDEELFVARSVSDDAKTVTEEFRRLSKEVFPDLSVAMIHGRMKPEEKSSVMTDFREGKKDILVATSVIEVGVDIPNASIMMIENADRFGLAQLYQFKGRVGRGPHASYCLLFSESSSEGSMARLKAVAEAKNGFDLAEKDLALRGPGEFLGGAQTGRPDLTMIALQDPEILKGSRRAAEEVLNGGIKLEEFAPLKEKLDIIQNKFHLE